MQKAEKRLGAILKKSKTTGIPPEYLSKLDIVQTLCHTSKPSVNRKKCTSTTVLLVLSIFLVALAYLFYDTECLLEAPKDASKIFREPENCKICLDVSQVDKIKDISTSDFEYRYVSKTKPVVITDGTRGWSAVNTFTFDFFKHLYKTSYEHDHTKTECQFFPYKTEFNSLEEVLNMSLARSRLEPGTTPWYIGWSNCNDYAGKILRQHYSRPYFLPKKSENIALNWIFMGCPGSGAHMHVDNVVYPSWQAQLQGRKTWRLAPPPECFYQCQEIEVTVEPGEIINHYLLKETHLIRGMLKLQVTQIREEIVQDDKAKADSILGYEYFKGSVEDADVKKYLVKVVFVIKLSPLDY